MGFLSNILVRIVYVIVAASMLIGARAHAADHDAQGWFKAVVKFPVAEHWHGSIEATGRFGNDLERLKQHQYKALLLRDVAPGMSLGAGYGYIVSNKVNAPNISENRIWQEMNWKPQARLSDFSFQFRTRLEEQFVEGGDDTGFRFRQRIKIKHPVPLGESAYAYGSGEVFFNLKDTDWGARSGFNRSRIEAGLGFGLTNKMSVEAGYLNQFSPKPNAADSMDHVLALTLTLKP